MKHLFTLIVLAFICPIVKSQTDSIPNNQKGDTTINNKKTDTIHIGKVSVIIHGKKNKTETEVTMGRKQKNKPSNVSTNWCVVDIGFANYIDKTNYGAAGDYLVNRPGYPGLGESDFKLLTGKSVNVNLWFFMQRLNLIKHRLNLKYGLGVELNNYRYRSSVSYKEDGIVPYSNPPVLVSAPFIFRDSIVFSKNKLAADYITVPLLLNFANKLGYYNKGLSFSAGISAGYLYSQRNKQKSSSRGKMRNKGEYDLERFKFSYIAEMGLGPIRIYGSYSPKSMYEKSLDFRPYTLGVRISSW